MTPKNSTRFELLFLHLWSDELGKNKAVRRVNVRVIVLDCLRDFKSEFLIEVDGIFIVCLNMQVNFWHVLL